MRGHVKILDVSARDGLQSVAKSVSTATKLELLRRLVDCGVRSLDVASFANPKLVPQLADGSELLKAMGSDPAFAGCRITCIVPNRRGLDRMMLAAEATNLDISVSIWVGNGVCWFLRF